MNAFKSSEKMQPFINKNNALVQTRVIESKGGGVTVAGTAELCIKSIYKIYILNIWFLHTHTHTITPITGSRGTQPMQYTHPSSIDDDGKDDED